MKSLTAQLLRRTVVPALSTALATTALATSPAGAQPAAPAVVPGRPAPIAAAGSGHDGWSAVLLSRGWEVDTGSLVVVSPNGARRTVRAGFSSWSWLDDISNDGRRVLVYDESTPTPSVRVVDTRTGRATAVPGRWVGLRFTNPTGTALLGRPLHRPDASGNPDGPVERLDASGRRRVTMAGTDGGHSILQNPAGTLVVSASRRGDLLVNANDTGALRRRMGLPRGAQDCTPGHFSDATHFTVACLTGPGSTWQVYRYATSGGAPVALTTRWQRTPEGAPNGFRDVWDTRAGRIATAASINDAPVTGRVTGTAWRALTPSAGGGTTLTAITAGQAYLRTGAECRCAEATLVRHDLATGRTTVLAGGRATPGLHVWSAVTAVGND